VGGRGRDVAGLIALLLLGLALRVAHPAADPPGWASSSYAALIDGGWYLASIAAPDDPDIPDSYRRPIYRAFAESVIGGAGGVSSATAILPGALPGALLAPALFLALRRAAGRRAAWIAAALAVVDPIHGAWSRTALPYPLLALGATAALGLALRSQPSEPSEDTERALGGPEGSDARRDVGPPGGGLRAVSLLALASVLVLALAYGVKPVALLALAPIAAVAFVRSGVRPRAAVVALVAPAIVVALVIAIHADTRARFLDYSGDLSVNEVVRRLAHLPVAARLVYTAPAILLACLIAPLVLRGPDRSRARRAAEAACLAGSAAGLALLLLLERPDVPYLLVAWPFVIGCASLALDRVAAGGAPALARPGLAGFGVALALAFVLLDLHGGTEAGAWLGDPYFMGPVRFGRTFVAATVAAALVVLAASRAAPLARALASALGDSLGAARPRLALAVGLSQAALAAWLWAPYLAAPERTLERARADLPGILPRNARVAEQFAHTLLLDERPGRGPRPRFCPSTGDPARDPERVASAGVTHLAISSDRWSGRAKGALLAAPWSAPAPVPITSIFVQGVRVRIVRLGAPGHALTAFERARERFDAGDLGASAALFAAALNQDPKSALVRTHLALARAVAGDLESAAPPLAESLAIDPHSPQALAVAALLDLRQGAAPRALERLRAVARRVRADRNVERIVDDLTRALAIGDAEALAAISGKRIELFAGDLLR